MYVDLIVAAGGASVSLGALFWASCAISVILRRYTEDASGPNDTEWKDTAFLQGTYQKLFRNGDYELVPKLD